MTERLTRWRLLVDGATNGAENMARDEALARSAGAEGTAVLRVYSFDPPAVTIGRFQRVPTDLDLDASLAEGLSVVRRPTGGLAILHSNDFTYSVAVPASAPGLSNRNKVFDTVAEAVILALGMLGIEAGKVSHGKGSGGRADWCFEGVFGVDLEWRGRKICGSAQRSMRGCVLQHGSLFLVPPDRKLLSIVSSMEQWGPGEAPFVTIREAAGVEVTWDELYAVFRAGFEKTLGITLEPDDLNPLEADLSRRLAERKYRGVEWLRHPRRDIHVETL